MIEIADKLLKQWEKLKVNKQRMILVIVLGLLIAYGDIALILRGELQWVGSTNSRVTKLGKEMASIKKDLRNLEGTKARYAYEMTQVKTILTEDQRQTALEYIYDTANQCDVKIVKLQPSSDAKVKPEMVDNTRLSPFLLNIDLLCGYHNLGTFINALEKGKYFFAVTQMQVARNFSDSFRHKITAVLKTYVKK